MVGLRQGWVVGELEQAPEGESALLRAGRAGDRGALEQLLAVHKRPLFALCHGMLGHADDAEDAVQETFLRALRALPGFREEAAFRTWLFRIAVNVCLKWKASRPRAERWEEERLESRPGAVSPEEIALRHLRAMEALDGLPPPRRAVLLLKVVEGWSVAEIARAMGWNRVRVQNELARARRALVEWQRREMGGGDEK